MPILVGAPSQASTVLAIPGNDAGGLFLSTNSGSTWTSIARGICDAHVNDAAFHPTAASTIFVATQSAGVCVTTDSGGTWTTVSSGLPLGTNNFLREVRAIAINPSTPATLIVGTSAGIYRSTDNGATWTLAGATGADVVGLEISPSTPTTAYAISNSLGAFKSLDGGATWLPASAGLPSSLDDGFLTIDPTNAFVAYVVADTVYKTSDGGTLWAPSNSGLGTPFFFSNVLVDPNTPATIYVNAIGGSGLSRSTTGGASWTSLNPTGLPDIPSFGVTGVSQVMFFEPGSSTNIYAGSPAGAYRSTNGGSAWTEITNNMTPQRTRAPGLQPGSGTGAASSLLVARRTIDDGNDLLKLAAGALPFTSLTSPFTGTGSGDIESIAVDPTNPNIIYLIGGTCATPYKSTDGGSIWTQMSSGIAASDCGQALVLDPSNPATLFVATYHSGAGSGIGLYKSTNGGGSWTAANTGLPGGSVNHLAVSPTNSNLLFAANGNQVYKSTNGGGTWSNASTGLPSSGSSSGIRRVAIDPGNAAIVYAATPAGVYQSTNAAVSWTARTTGWPTVNGAPYGAGAIAIDPVTPTTLLASPATPALGPGGFLGTEARGIGLYRSTDSGATWTIEPGPIGGAIVNDIVFDADRTIFASTNNGVFKFATPLPTMTLDRTSLTFSAVTDGTAFLSRTPNQTVRLTQSGTGTVTWTAASNVPWLTVSPTSGSGSATLTMSVQFASGLAASQPGSITLTFTGASTTAGPISVTLNTIPATAAVAPFGLVETPTDGITGVAGSIAVTGWTLDDIAVTRVRVMRSPVAGEGTADIFIGDAIFVDGARPDVQASFPGYPLSSRAGFGYLLLTNFLPGLGNGTFTLKVFADDADGHSTLLGSKVITCDNANSIAPFGAIDTPGQGETISGTILNFGWVLSPGTRRADPPGGGQVSVFVDGVNLGTPSGWGARADIVSLFPKAQYDGTDTAVAALALDSTTLSNGVHTIFWITTATSGGASGVGSRFFSVLNGSASLEAATTAGPAMSRAIAAHPTVDMSRAAMSRLGGQASLRREVDALHGAAVAIDGRRGFDLDTPLVTFEPLDGRVVVQSEELDRIELRLASGGADDFTGYLRTVDGFKPLPVGSALDRSTGTFTWGAGPGFVGAYDLVFVRWNEGRAIARQDVRVVLNPKGSNRIGTQTVIDIANGSLVAGWAADFDSQVDGGVDTVHVWAYPADGSDPIFVGPAAFGGKRPDVAAIYGERFGQSGYGIRLDALPPGTYNVAVFAYSTVAGRFAPAKTARVVVGR